ncbi:MAG: HU family DNA-binding protein [Acidithiobacillus sp.]|jgi:nucleoid DNA-binding protein|uniref:HU family DNA-binding protein n=1 Tax=Acidithiobacillus sp. TaxID=1872118 RepID=UPI0035611192
MSVPGKENQYRMANLVEDVQKMTGLAKKDARTAVDAVVYSIVKGTLETKYSNIVGLGKFVVKTTKGGTRSAFGREVTSVPKNKVKFAPSRRFRKVVNGEIDITFQSGDDEDDE